MSNRKWTRLAIAILLMAIPLFLWLNSNGVLQGETTSGSSGDNEQSDSKTEYGSTVEISGPVQMPADTDYDILLSATTDAPIYQWSLKENNTPVDGQGFVFGNTLNKTKTFNKSVAGDYVYLLTFRGVMGAHGWPPNTTVAITVTVLAAPNAPSNLVATAVSSSQINLTWQDNSNNEDGFTLERAIVYEEDSPVADHGYYEVATTLPANATSYADTGLAYGTRYYYRLKAFNQVGDSYYSRRAYAMTFVVVEAPSNLVATAVSSSRIDLTWQDNSLNEQGFIIERGVLGVSDSYKPITTIGTVNLMNYSDTGLDWDMRYAYRVKAYNSLGQSHPSNEVEAITPRLEADEVINLLDQYYQDGLIQNNGGIYDALSGTLHAADNSLVNGNFIAAANQLNAFSNLVSAQTGKKIDAGAGQVLLQLAGAFQHINAQIRGGDGKLQGPSFIPVCEPVTITANVGPAIAGQYSWSISTTAGADVRIVGGSISGTVTASDPVTKTSIAIHAYTTSTALGDITIRFSITPTNPSSPTVTASKPMTAVKVDLTFRNSGRISPQNENDKRNSMSSEVGTDLLGVIPPTTTAHTGWVRNVMELVGTIRNITPTVTSQFNLKRDVNGKTWVFTPTDVSTPGKQPTVDPASVKHAFGGPPAANDDKHNWDEDITPSQTGKVYVVDPPAIYVDHPNYSSLPVGSVLARRFYAKEWSNLCTNGDRVSPVFEWVMSITIRKKADGSWERVGKNEIRPVNRSPGADGPDFEPDRDYKPFLRDEALAAQGQ